MPERLGGRRAGGAEGAGEAVRGDLLLVAVEGAVVAQPHLVRLADADHRGGLEAGGAGRIEAVAADPVQDRETRIGERADEDLGAARVLVAQPGQCALDLLGGPARAAVLLAA